MKTPVNFRQWNGTLYSEIINSKIDWFHALGEEMGFQSVWSIFEVEDFNQVPYPEIISLKYDLHWGSAPVIHHFEGNVGQIPWMGLWRAAESLIRLSGDTHHIFIEQFVSKSPGHFTLYTGS